ncbi:MAG TPA: polysaccharide lyase 6 family protein [Xanthomonadaceae bacterium]|nr:polysaccharide lyase 6 family protein [Xanthomonadaceae bacterium]
MLEIGRLTRLLAILCVVLTCPKVAMPSDPPQLPEVRWERNLRIEGLPALSLDASMVAVVGSSSSLGGIEWVDIIRVADGSEVARFPLGGNPGQTINSPEFLEVAGARHARINAFLREHRFLSMTHMYRMDASTFGRSGAWTEDRGGWRVAFDRSEELLTIFDRMSGELRLKMKRPWEIEHYLKQLDVTCATRGIPMEAWIDEPFQIVAFRVVKDFYAHHYCAPPEEWVIHRLRQDAVVVDVEEPLLPPLQVVVEIEPPDKPRSSIPLESVPIRIGQALRLFARPSPEVGVIYRWSVTDRPRDSGAEIFDDLNADALFMPDRVGVYLLEVFVTTGQHESAPMRFAVVAEGVLAPSAAIGPEGGAVGLPDGAAVLVPPGALAENAVIAIATMPEDRGRGHPSVRLGCPQQPAAAGMRRTGSEPLPSGHRKGQVSLHQYFSRRQASFRLRAAASDAALRYPQHMKSTRANTPAVMPSLCPDRRPVVLNPVCRIVCRPLAVAAMLAFACMAQSGIETTTRSPRMVPVDSLVALQQAIAVALPGDEIVLADGVYQTSRTSDVMRHGTPAEPIVIRAQTIGGARIEGAAGFRVRQSSHVVVRGFVLAHAIWGGETGNNNRNGLAFEVRDSQHVRVSRNRFVIDDTTERSIWLLVTGRDSGHHRIDHNAFLVKPSANVFMAVYGNDSDGNPQVSQHDVIEYNYFFAQISGDGECLRTGDSARGPQSAFTIVRGNLFEQCVSDDEVISNKSSDNLFLGNTFRDNIGSLTLRHGNRNRVDGNFFLFNQGGIRLYGHDHRIVNNYFEGNSGIGAKGTLVINSGCNEEDTGQPTDCARPKRVVVAFNTLVDNVSTHLDIGATVATRPLAPQDCTIDNNILQGGSGQLVRFLRQPIGFSWAGNILFGAASDGDLPAEGYVRVDPELFRASDGLYRISQTSPARHAAQNVPDYPWVTEDMDGQPRANSVKDIGADRPLAAAPVRFPLQPDDVGPHARLHAATPLAGPGGALVPDWPQWVDHGDRAAFLVVPAPGFAVAGISGTCGGSLSGDLYETAQLTGDCTVEVDFAADYSVFLDGFEGL